MSLDGPSHVQKPTSETRPKDGYTRPPPHNKWAPEKEAALIAKAEAGQSNASIAREWGMTRDAVCNKRAKMTKAGLIDPIKGLRWTAEDEAKLSKLKADGHCSRAIAKVMGKTIAAIQGKAQMLSLGPVDLSESDRFAENAREATTKLVALLCEHHPEHETRL